MSRKYVLKKDLNFPLISLWTSGIFGFSIIFFFSVLLFCVCSEYWHDLFEVIFLCFILLFCCFCCCLFIAMTVVLLLLQQFLLLLLLLFVKWVLSCLCFSGDYKHANKALERKQKNKNISVLNVSLTFLLNFFMQKIKCGHFSKEMQQKEKSEDLKCLKRNDKRLYLRNLKWKLENLPKIHC